MEPKKPTHDEIINKIRNIQAERLPELYDLVQGFLQGQKRDYARKQLSGEVDWLSRTGCIKGRWRISVPVEFLSG